MAAPTPPRISTSLTDTTADRHSPKPRQDLRRRQGALLDGELGYLLHDAVPELLDAELVELVLDLRQADLNVAASSSAAWTWAASAAFLA